MFRWLSQRISLETIGIVISLAYLGVLAGIAKAKWIEFSKLDPNEWGDFLAGSLGPLALFWLILGFFRQGRELQNSVEALKLQTEELRGSVEQQTALVKVTEKQLELDRIAREREAEIVMEHRMPHFIVRLDRISEESRLVEWRYVATNVGAAAQTVQLQFQPESINRTSFSPITKNSVDQGDDITMVAEVAKLEGNQSRSGNLLIGNLLIELENTRLERKEQVFAINGPQITQISSSVVS